MSTAVGLDVRPLQAAGLGGLLSGSRGGPPDGGVGTTEMEGWVSTQ